MKYIPLILLILLPSCYILSEPENTPTRPVVMIPSPSPESSPIVTIAAPTTAATLPINTFEALPVMQGICFEAAWDAAGQVFIMRTAEEHIHFYDLADNSHLCSRPIERLPFDFSGGDVLAGLWRRGIGCTASYEIEDYQRDDTAKTIQIQAQFIISGECPYELVRGFWLGFIDAHDYQINIDIEQ